MRPSPVREVKTCPVELGRVARWSNHSAWMPFVERYTPLVRRWATGVVGRDAHAVEEIAQRTWIGLARDLRTFRYDPARSFRAWLRLCTRRRALEYLRRKHRPVTVAGDELDRFPWPSRRSLDSSVLDGAQTVDQALDVAEEVRQRVEPRTWRAWEMKVLEGRPLDEVAAETGKTYMAAAQAVYRVSGMLRAAGARRSITARQLEP